MAAVSGRQAASPSPFDTLSSEEPEYAGASGAGAVGAQTVGRTLKPKVEPLWRSHDAKAQKSGKRSTIYWVGKAIVGEDRAPTGTHAKGASYQGEWHDNKKDGYGVQVFPSGEKYEGQWGSGRRNGQGTLWAPVGKAQKLRKVYVGGWMNDKRHGRGTCFFKNGEFFQGCWNQGKMHGEGTLRYASGDLYVGEWHDGQRSGKGTLNRANGDCYEGFWLNDKREGSGSFFYADSGKVFVGEWADDLPKAGVYTQAVANPEQAGGVQQTSELPPVRLAEPTEVLVDALADVRHRRKAFRAANMPVQRLFSDEELEALRGAFDQARRPDGLAGPMELQALCSLVGTDLHIDRLRDLLVAAGFDPGEAHGELDVALSFEDFLRLVAVLLDDEDSLEVGAAAGIDEASEDDEGSDL